MTSKQSAPPPPQTGGVNFFEVLDSLVNRLSYDIDERRRGVPRTEEAVANITEGLRNSEKAKAFHASRVGKINGKSASGHYGVIFDKSRNKYQVRIRGKLYGRYPSMDEALLRAKEVMKSLNMVDEEVQHSDLSTGEEA